MACPDRLVTYSSAYTLVPTYECFNRCTYCNFRVDPGQGTWLSLAEAASCLQGLRDRGVIEILILSGEVHPLHPQRSAWCHHLYQLGQLALSLGFLPHTNAGPLSLEEMALLKTVNVSMGLMLEQLAPRLLETVHRHAPSKRAELRLQQLAWAGELQIPFTTGLLLGIGETEAERCDTLAAIAQVHLQWNHIQEVILQPYSPGQQELWAGDRFNSTELIKTVALARQILPPEITIQIPPNLIREPEVLIACLEAGARDLGGIGPVDEVNPDYPHLKVNSLETVLQPQGWQLVPRLPVYPQHDRWLNQPLRTVTDRWRSQLADPLKVSKIGDIL